jgi:DNA mismatch repair protein MutS
MTQEKSTTPMMAQWQACKNEAKDALVLFRLGDFYEAFHDDAVTIAKKASLTLTRRQGIPMCGVPAHTLDQYLDKLVAAGLKLAIAEQVENPKETKGIVKRKIVRYISAGTLINSSLLKEKANNYFASLCQVGSSFAIAYADISTSEFNVVEFSSLEELFSEIHRVRPTEFLLSKQCKNTFEKKLEELSYHFSFTLNVKENWLFDHQFAVEKLNAHFSSPLDSFGLKGMVASINAAGALIFYLEEELKHNLEHIQSIQIKSLASYMRLDFSTMKNLDLSVEDNKHTLVNFLDNTSTSMGARLLKKWICHPLVEKEGIQNRLDAVEELISSPEKVSELSSYLEKVKDIERLMMKVSSGYASPRDLLYLCLSLENITFIKKELMHFSSPLLAEIQKKLEDLTPIIQKVKSSLVELPPLKVHDGGVFRKGFHHELDELRLIKTDGKTWIANYQNKLREETKIKTLKVGFTKVFGYYIDVSKGQSDKVPDFFQRRQTLVNSERFITQELKEYEVKVFSAEERIKALESTLYEELRKEVANYQKQVAITATKTAEIDLLVSFSQTATANNYVKPIVNLGSKIEIKDGRHPLIESSVGHNYFIANDTSLQEGALFLITGPNMAGKSTYIRQVAIIVILAQIGCYVPAAYASVGIVDQVFSRIGASDDLSRGQSTFMVEMMETSYILKNASEKSLVILDEIGRGTSTYDGISIAWAVAEYLLEKKVKTLFATHYWELTKITKDYPSAKNFQVSVKENPEDIVFLHKIVEGSTDKSYGIHVAKLAGLPLEVLQKAKKMLKELEKTTRRKQVPEKQLSLFAMQDPQPQKEKDLLDNLRSLEIDHMTPMQALEKLLFFQKQLL